MKVNRFTAPTMAEALKQVKATLGAEAVILETTEAPGQVTVTAAVDLDAPGAATTEPADGALLSEVRELMSVVRELVDEQWRRQPPPGGRGIRRLHRALLAQGVDGVIAAALLRETAERLERGTRLDTALAAALGAAPPPTATPSVRLFFGPPGDGKTTTVVKLAAQARRAGRRVLLVGTDTYRLGAALELERYAQALGAEIRRAADPAALTGVLGEPGRADLVLV